MTASPPELFSAPHKWGIVSTQKIVVIVLLGEIVFGTGVPGQRRTIAELLDVVDRGGNPPVPVAVESEEVQGDAPEASAVH